MVWKLCSTYFCFIFVSRTSFVCLYPKISNTSLPQNYYQSTTILDDFHMNCKSSLFFDSWRDKTKQRNPRRHFFIYFRFQEASHTVKWTIVSSHLVSSKLWYYPILEIVPNLVLKATTIKLGFTFSIVKLAHVAQVRVAAYHPGSFIKFALIEIPFQETHVFYLLYSSHMESHGMFSKSASKLQAVEY